MADPVLDLAFGSDGTGFVVPGVVWKSGFECLPGDELVALGHAMNPLVPFEEGVAGAGDWQFRPLTGNGTFKTAFAGGGLVEGPPPLWCSYAAVAQPDGKLLVVGAGRYRDDD